MSVSQLADKLRPKLIEVAWMLRELPNADSGQRSQILGAIEMIVRDVKHELEQPLPLDSTANEFYSQVQPILDQVKSVEDLVSHARRTTSFDRFCDQDAHFLENCIGFIDGIQTECNTTEIPKEFQTEAVPQGTAARKYRPDLSENRAREALKKAMDSGELRYIKKSPQRIIYDKRQIDLE